MRHLHPLIRTGLVSLFLVGLLFGYCDQSYATSPDALSGDNAVNDAAAANVDTLPTRDFSYLEETLDPKITDTAKLIGPAATDGTKLVLDGLVHRHAVEDLDHELFQNGQVIGSVGANIHWFEFVNAGDWTDRRAAILLRTGGEIK